MKKLRKIPYLISIAGNDFPTESISLFFKTHERPSISTPRIIKLTQGIMISDTNDLVKLPNAVPNKIPSAILTKFARKTKEPNELRNLLFTYYPNNYFKYINSIFNTNAYVELFN